MHARARATWTALIMAGLLIGSCTDVATTSTTQPTTTTTAVTTQPIDQFGFVRSLSGGVLVFDPAELLIGDAALAAAREAGLIGADENLPNDFYIQNPDETDEWQLTVAEGTEFVLIGFDASGGLTDSPVSADELETLLGGSADNSQFYGFIAGDLPMTLTLHGDTVAGGTQTYLP